MTQKELTERTGIAQAEKGMGMVLNISFTPKEMNKS